MVNEYIILIVLEELQHFFENIFLFLSIWLSETLIEVLVSINVTFADVSVLVSTKTKMLAATYK